MKCQECGQEATSIVFVVDPYNTRRAIKGSREYRCGNCASNFVNEHRGCSDVIHYKKYIAREIKLTPEREIGYAINVKRCRDWLNKN